MAGQGLFQRVLHQYDVVLRLLRSLPHVLLSLANSLQIPLHVRMFCSVLFFSRPRSEGWPHHGRTVSIYLCPLAF